MPIPDSAAPAVTADDPAPRDSFSWAARTSSYALAICWRTPRTAARPPTAPWAALASEVPMPLAALPAVFMLAAVFSAAFVTPSWAVAISPYRRFMASARAASRSSLRLRACNSFSTRRSMRWASVSASAAASLRALRTFCTASACLPISAVTLATPCSARPVSIWSSARRTSLIGRPRTLHCPAHSTAGPGPGGAGGWIPGGPGPGPSPGTHCGTPRGY